jgi:hypothetical protein
MVGAIPAETVTAAGWRCGGPLPRGRAQTLNACMKSCMVDKCARFVCCGRLNVCLISAMYSPTKHSASCWLENLPSTYMPAFFLQFLGFGYVLSGCCRPKHVPLPQVMTMSSCLRESCICTDTYMHACMHTYIHAYKHTYMRRRLGTGTAGTSNTQGC